MTEYVTLDPYEHPPQRTAMHPGPYPFLHPVVPWWEPGEEMEAIECPPGEWATLETA